MRVHPVTGRPEAPQMEQTRRAALTTLVTEGHRVAQALASHEGRQHLQDMLDDYQRFTDQLTMGKAFLKTEIPKEILLAKMDYIQERLKGWGLTVEFGRRARAQLEKELTQSLFPGGPASAD